MSAYQEKKLQLIPKGKTNSRHRASIRSTHGRDVEIIRPKIKTIIISMLRNLMDKVDNVTERQAR